MKDNHYLNHYVHQVSLYLDKELGKEDELNLLKRADSDPVCNVVLKKEASFRDLIKFNVKRSIASVELIDHIKNQVLK